MKFLSTLESVRRNRSCHLDYMFIICICNISTRTMVVLKPLEIVSGKCLRAPCARACACSAWKAPSLRWFCDSEPLTPQRSRRRPTRRVHRGGAGRRSLPVSASSFTPPHAAGNQILYIISCRHMINIWTMMPFFMLTCLRGRGLGLQGGRTRSPLRQSPAPPGNPSAWAGGAPGRSAPRFGWFSCYIALVC